MLHKKGDPKIQMFIVFAQNDFIFTLVKHFKESKLFSRFTRKVFKVLLNVSLVARSFKPQKGCDSIP